MVSSQSQLPPAAASLAAAQREFMRWLDAPQPASETPGLRRGARGEPAALAVYHHAYRARLAEALASNYPQLHQVLGDEAFDALALDYAQAHPSRRPSIRWFGDQLPAWLWQQPRHLPHPALADLAAMEWALGLSFDAADAEPLAFEALVQRAPDAWPGACFAAHPSVHLLDLQWAVEPLWQTLSQQPDAQTEPPPAHAHVLLVWRQDLQTRWRSLEPDEACLLRACVAGLRFDALGELAQRRLGEPAALQLARWLRAWVDDGLLLEAAPPA